MATSHIRPVTRPSPPKLRTEAETRKRVRRWFALGKPRWPRWVLGGGVVVALAGIGVLIGGLSSGFGLLAIALGAAAGCVGYVCWKRPPRCASEREVDGLAERDLAEARERALTQCQVELSELRGEEPICFRNTRNSRELAGVLTKKRTGEDGRVRWTPHEVCVVLVGHERLYIYKSIVDLTTGRAMHEETHEIALRDIVSLDWTGARDTHAIGAKKKKDVDTRKYWAERGDQATYDALQLEGVQNFAVRVMNEDSITLASWEGHVGMREPLESPLNRAACQRLRRSLREPRAESGARALRPPKIVRQSGNGS